MMVFLSAVKLAAKMVHRTAGQRADWTVALKAVLKAATKADQTADAMVMSRVAKKADK